MNKDKKVFYILTCVLAGTFLLCCFVPKSNYTNLIIAFVAAALAVAFGILIKKRSLLNINYRQVILVMLTAAVMLVVIYFLSGLGFGFYKTPLAIIYLTKYILPFAVAIIAAEYIRRVALSGSSGFVICLCYIALVLLDIALFSDNNILQSFAKFVDFCGMTLFPAITANVLYMFIAKRYGALPNIAYRLIISLYPYLTPIKPEMPPSMLAFLRVLLPLIVLLFIRTLYEKKAKTSTRKSRVASTLAGALSVILMTGFIMLITCKFSYGLLVVATESMTGTLNKGDALIYESYDDQIIEVGQVIVFNLDNKKTIHRVVDIEKINGELRFYTKGDANDALDLGYITTNDIIGTEVLKIKYLGYPTVWVRELFNNK